MELLKSTALTRKVKKAIAYALEGGMLEPFNCHHHDLYATLKRLGYNCVEEKNDINLAIGIISLWYEGNGVEFTLHLGLEENGTYEFSISTELQDYYMRILS